MTKYLEFDTPATKQAQELASDYRLKNHGLVHLERVFWNLPTAALYEEAVFRNEGHVAYGGPLIVNTGEHTARAAADKFIVKEHTTEDKVWWGEYNRPFSSEKFNGLLTRLQAFLQEFTRDLVHQLQSQSIFRPNAWNLLELSHGGLQHSSEAIEAPECFTCNLFTVPPGSCQGQEEFDDLLIRQLFQTVIKELLPKPLTMASNLLLPIVLIHRGAPLSSWQLELDTKH